MQEHNLRMNMKLEQRLTPQLIQSLQLLQVPLLELELMIRNELVANPFLEETVKADTETEETPVDVRDEFVAPSVAEHEDNDSKIEKYDWDAYIDAGYERENYRRRGYEQREERETVFVRQTTLAEELQFQLRMTNLTPEEMKIGEQIIGNINEEGFLGVSLEEMALSLSVPVATIEKVLAVVQTFEPAGIAARTINECLLIQLKEKGEADPITVRIVQDFLPELEKRHLAQIAKALSITEDDVRQVLKKISPLNPRPGQVANEVPRIIVPDVMVEKVDNEYLVYLNDKSTPTLRINPLYRSIIKQKGRESAETKKFVVDKLNAARWLIKAIQQRRDTIVRVANYIVQQQIPFFEKGVQFLKPMVMQGAADALSLHVATISRVVDGKYMQTPRGMFEFKYFFSIKIASDGNDQLSSKSVKERIRELIEDEADKKNLSDQEIVDLLAKEGTRLARRTVAKYRSQLNILPARYRQKL